MVWLRGLAALAFLWVAIPAGANTLQEEFSGFGECLQQEVQPRADRIRREVYRDDAWVPAPRPPKLRPDFPGVPRPSGTGSPAQPPPATGI
jgi:hypothetical protein